MDTQTIQPSLQRTSPSLAARIWQVLGHPAVLLLLLVLLLPALIADVWVPQAPSLVGDDTLARNAWMAATAALYPAGELLQAMGLFDLAHSILLRLLMSLLAAVLAVRLFNRLHLAWATRQLSAPQLALPLTSSYDFALKTAVEPEQWEGVCMSQCQRQQQENAEGTRRWWGDRHQPFTWLAALIELGLMLLLLSLALNLRFGWQLDEVSLDPGGLAQLEPYSVQTLTFSEDAETLSLCCKPEQHAVITGGNRRLGNLWVRQIEISPALRIDVLANEQALLLHPIEQGGSPEQELILRFPQQRSERAVAIPERNLFLRIVHTGPDQYNVEALDASSTVLLSQKIEGGSSLHLDDMALHFTPTRNLKLGVASRPWLWLLIPGILCISAGLFTRWRFPYLRVGALTDSTSMAMRWQGQQGAHPTPAEIGNSLGDSSL